MALKWPLVARLAIRIDPKFRHSSDKSVTSVVKSAAPHGDGM